MNAYSQSPFVAVLIVGFRTPHAIATCLRALGRATPIPHFDVFIAENGGAEAAARLVATLTAPGGPCEKLQEGATPLRQAQGARQTAELCLLAPDGKARCSVFISDMIENRGYAGGVNGWLATLACLPGWTGAWVLNPDTVPSADALLELTRYAAEQGKGMVASRLVHLPRSGNIQLRGLAWSRLRAVTVGIDPDCPASIMPSARDVEARMGSPSGASMYASRKLIERIGPMNDDYFLYYEDLDWGYCAKALDAIGYADRAVVAHAGGSTIKSQAHRAERSPMAVYLQFRNRILFVRRHFPNWMAWTLLMQGAHLGSFAAVGAWRNLAVAARGLRAGLRGETGAPPVSLARH